MDMQMPVLGGIGATKQILARERAEEPPAVVFVTAHALDTYRREATDAGGCAFIAKPFNIEKIREVLKSLGYRMT